MDMKFFINHASNAAVDNDYNLWQLLTDAISENALSDDENVELFKLAGMPCDVAEFLTEWYPETAMCAVDNIRYTYGFDHTLMHMSEEELQEHLCFLGVSRDEYENSYGTIIQDVAFDGVVVCGE